ncbi:carbohydrate ABC transporter permease [Deinococcus ruber]|uniref:ABC transporter permease n=1 Tax=Deinococcus ruber TaxID=1848197 RepID=A0A918FAN4_9DEIO|nr:carbohydrate ABC transporter permease [Deinococcus ruber]GGR21691.1 ABC transporter permease [Deinococcus ruber]
MTIVAPSPSSAPLKQQDNTAFLNRRRWARAGWLYLFMLVMSVLFLGPFLMGTLSSLKDNPNEYPPRILIPQLRPTFFMRAYQLGVQGAGDGWNGGLAPGNTVTFDVRVRNPKGAPQTPPTASLFVYQPTGLVNLARLAQAKDYSVLKVAETGVTGDLHSYRVTVTYAPLTAQTGERVRGELLPPQGNDLMATVNGKPVKVTLDTPQAQAHQYDLQPTQPVQLIRRGDQYFLEGPLMARLPLEIDVERGQVFVDSTLPPSDVQNFGRSLAFRNATPGILGYTFNNYRRAFQETRDAGTGRSLFLSWTLNTFAIAILKVLSAVVFCSLAGYALARLNFPGKNLLFALVLFVQMVPGQTTFISNYLVLKNLGLLNIWGLLVSGLVTAGGVFLMKQFFEGLPKELEEAASIDGASPFTTFWRVMLPQASPALIALSITTFQGAWNDFFWPLVVLKGDASRQVLTVGLQSFRDVYGGAGDYGLILSGAILSAIPVLIVFLIFQRYFVGTGADSAVKG